MSKNFLSICLGISAVLVSLSLFLFSIQQLRANDSNDFLNPTTVPLNTGKYWMDLEIDVQENGVRNEKVIVWDTETGASKIYFLRGKTYQATRQQLPENPL